MTRVATERHTKKFQSFSAALKEMSGLGSPRGYPVACSLYEYTDHQLRTLYKYDPQAREENA